VLLLRIVDLDKKRGLIVIHVDNLDDLYVLFNFIAPGDFVTARTSRKIKIREGEAFRKSMILTIEVKAVSFHEFAERLRVRGLIRSGPEKFVSIGSHHTINVKVGDTIQIERPGGFTDEDLEILREAEKIAGHRPILIIAIEEGEATIGILTSYGVRIYATIRKNISKGADEYDSLLKAFFSQILDAINELMNQIDPIAIIIAGPGFTKEYFQEYLKEKLSRKVPIVIDSVTSGTAAGIYEVIRRGTPDKVLSDQRVSKETALIEELLMHIGKKDNLAVYGLNEVEEVVNYGLARTLLVSMRLINTVDKELRDRILNIIKKAKTTRCEVILISTMHPSGKQFASLGGIAAILKYPLKKW